MKSLTVLAILLFYNGYSNAVQWHMGRFPNPLESPEKCGRPEGDRTFICDPDGILTQEQTDDLEKVIIEIQKNIKCPCSSYMCDQSRKGYYVGISMVKEMEYDKSGGDSSNSLQNTLHTAKLFAYTQLERWTKTGEMGQCNENIMIFYSQKDNALWTVTGEVAHKKLTNEMIGHVAMNRRHEFNYGDKSKGRVYWTYSALKNMLEDYRMILNGDYQPPAYSWNDKPKTGAVKSAAQRSVFSSGAALLTCFIAAIFHPFA